MLATARQCHADYLPEASVYPNINSLSGRCELHYRVEDWLGDSSYTALSNTSIMALFECFKTDSAIRAATEMYHSILFAGGVQIEREGASMQPNAKRWYEYTWTNWAREVDTSLCVLGFAACTVLPDADYVGRPVVLNLSNTLVLFKLDVYNQPHFVFFERVEGASNVNWSLRYIPNVVVYVDQAPTGNGYIQSKIQVLSEDIELERQLIASVVAASKGRCNPTLVVESVNEAYDNEAITSTISPVLLNSANNGEQGRSPQNPLPMPTSDAQRAHAQELERQQYAYSRLLGEVGPEGMRAHAQMTVAMQQRQQRRMPEHEVEDGKKAVNVHLPEGPEELLMNFRNARVERVFNMFGIPMGMVSSGSTSSLSGKTSMNENANTVFVDTQKQRKQLLLTFINDMYRRIYEVHHKIQKLKTWSTSKSSSSSSSSSSIHDVMSDPDIGVTITLSGLAQYELLKDLWMMGALTYEAFVSIVSSKYAIPQHFFNEECEMELKDLNGVKPEAIGSEAAGKKKPAKD
jgi:hypothetical protein